MFLGPGRCLGLACLLLLPTACRRAPEAAVIGVAFAPASSYTQAARFAGQELEATRRPGDLPIVLRQVETLLSDAPDTEVERAQELLRMPGLVAVVGHSGSRGSLVSAPLYNAARVPQVVPTGTSRLLRGAGPWTFSLAPDDSVEGSFMVRFARERLGARRVTVLYTNDEYGTGLRDGIELELRRLGLDTLDEIPCDAASDFGTLLRASLRRGTPDVILAATRARETGALVAAADTVLPGVAVVSGDGARAPGIPLEAGHGSVYVVSFWTPPPGDTAAQSFVRRFRRAIGRDPQSSDAMTYDAVRVVAAAIRAVGPERNAIRQWLASLGVTQPPWPGLTGPVAFNQARPPRLIMTQLVRGAPAPMPVPGP